MSTVMDIGDVVSIRLNYRDDQGSILFNVLHYTFAEADPIGSGTPPFESAAAEEVVPALTALVVNTWAAAWVDVSSTGILLEGGTGQSIYPSPLSRQYNYTPETPYQGEVAGDMMPSQDAVTLLKRTPFGGRGGIGRMFVPGIPEASQSSGRLTPTAFEEYKTLAEFIPVQRVITNGNYTLKFNPVLFRRTTAGGAFLQTITAGELSDGLLKTQRRRRPGKGI